MHASGVETESNKPTSSFTVINTQQDKSIQYVKVIDLIRARSHARDRFYSIEVSHTGQLLSLNFNDFIIRPLFTSVTWFSNNMEIKADAVEPAIQLMNAITSTPTILHLTCYKLTEMTLEKLMNMRMKHGNILALRGDIVTSSQIFRHAIDLVKRIKQTHPDASLSVAGYPDLHPESLSLELDMKYLREKVDAGADFIITQSCFCATKILEFVKNCRDVGIEVPIVPGIFVPHTYGALKSMCRICKISVPTEQFRMYKSLKDDTKAFQDYAVGNAIELLNDLFNVEADVVVTGVHFFTLNNFELIHRVTSNFDFK